jgi:hypothetical protein
MGTSEDIEERRAARRARLETRREEQRLADMAALDAAEEAHGPDRIISIEVTAWTPDVGLPTMVVARVPLGSDAVFRRFEQEASAGKEGSPRRLDAAHKLGRSCLVHPDGAGLAALEEYMPGILSAVALEVVRRAQGRAAEAEKD